MTSQLSTEQAYLPRSPWRRSLQTSDHGTGLILRLTLAAVMFPHGAQKALGWFGGYGFSGTLSFFTDSVGLPWLLGFGIIALELLGPLFLLAGLATRALALGFVGLMIGAIVTTHAAHGFFMNWFGAQAGEGFEYHLLVIGIALALALGGAGRASVDRWLSREA